VKARILIVDDTPANLGLLAGMLQKEGYKVRAFLEGKTAIEAARAAPPDIILLDVEMPEMNGYQVCAELKKDPKLAQVPVLYVSALAETSDKIKAFESGGVDYITKPFQFEEVRARVETHLALRQLQRNLETKYDELRALEDLRDNLTHMIVHDLRSPLGAVSGLLQLARMNPNASSDDLRRYMSRAEVGISTLMEMISSLLDVNRFEAGEMPLSREVCDLKTISAQAAKSIEGLLAGRDFREEAPETPVRVSCDPEIIRRVLVNLISNALKFTPSSGSVAVAIARQDTRARVEVRDTGYGIPSEYLNRIFDKFGQVETRKERAVYSTGLGLTFCKLAVEAHQGAIGVTSEVGKGSTFWFELSTHDS
jgi:two-component system sensor histidine kinase/response regulator